MTINIKKIEKIIFHTFCLISLLFVVLFIISFFALIIVEGIKNIDLFNTITKFFKEYNYDESLLAALIGSILISIIAIIISQIISVPIAIFMNINSIKNCKINSLFRLWLKTIIEIPHLIYGVFGFIIMSTLGIGYSLLSGIIIMSILIIPYTIATYDNLLNRIDKNYLYFYSLYNAKGFILLLKKSYKALIITILMSFIVIVGNASTILFTTGFSDFIPTKITDPVSSLPLYILFNMNSPIILDREKANAAVFILAMLIIFNFVLVKIFSKNFYERNKN